MAYQSIGLGSTADDDTGDTLRSGGDKVNDNFVELYTLLGDATDLSSGISATSSVITLTAPTISGVVGGTQTSATITTLTSTTVNAGTLALAAGSVTDSSGAISFGNENLVTTGTFGAGNITVGTITSTGATIVLEGATADAYETTLTVTDPTADRTITFPNITGTVVTTGDTGTVSGTMIANDAIDSSHYTDGSIDTVHIADNQVTLAKMAANSVDSDQYVDGSIDVAHMSDNSVDSAQYVDGSIDLVHMSDNSIDSAQYVDGSIDLVHMSDNSVDSAQYVDGSIDLAHMSADSIDSTQYVDGSIDTAHIADNQITGAKLNPSLVAGDIIYASATDTIARLGKGSDDEVLTLASGLPSWSSIEAFPAGTLMLFQQTSAPTGWTKITSHNDKALRVVSGTASTGGSVAFETAFTSQTPAGSISSSLTNGSVSGTVGNTTLTTSQIPAHDHDQLMNTGNGNRGDASSYPSGKDDASNNNRHTSTNATDTISISNTGGGAVHTHSWSGSISGGSVSSSFSGTAIDLNVQFVDVIIASKD